ncbi:response regulator [Celeribacter halophilus]|uniref:response regulator n=1 Tax=Celeribacter halophilus TaxID=576117 RepID=UPI001C085AA0|nr:response regulator [Celeribacter halophilus]MBU2890263.1 response regulator [Celeribacter halophilus]MDO6511650.1 response regulator [Celeribacter halophilus]
MSQRIMAVDDSDIAQEFIRSNLAELGFDNVVSFMDPRAALEAIENGEAEADLILMDIMMPEIDGIELCARIRVIDAWRDIPIIMLTSRKDMDALSSAFMAGANDYVTKPFDRIELQARMRSCLRLKSELDRRRAIEHRGKRRGGQGASNGSQSEVSHVMLGSQAGLQADFRAMSPEAQSALGLVVLKIDSLCEKRALTDFQKAEIIQATAKALADVPMTAGENFVHWEEGLFCFASLRASEDDLRARAQSFIKAVQAAKITTPDTWEKAPVSISAVLAPKQNGTIGHRLGKAIQLVENICETGQLQTITVLPSQRNDA